MDESDASDTANETPFIEVDFDDDFDDDVAHFQELIDAGKIPPPPIITMPSDLLDKIVPRMPTFESLGLSATLSRMLTPEALGITNIVRGSILTDSLTAQLAARIPTFKMPDVSRLIENSVSANLTERMSRVVDSLASSVMKQFDSTILRSIPSWLPDLASLQLHLPTNWRGVKVDVDEIEQDVFQILSEGIPLAWVPDRRVIGLLLDAPDARARRRVISNNHRGIVSACVNVAGSLPLGGRPLFLADTIVRSVRALQDGHVEAAQALATNVLDTLVTGYSRAALGRSKSGMLNPSYANKLSEDRSWRLQLALGATFAVMRGEHTVHERHNAFHRNATAHAVTSHQYSRINAVLAIMNATSVLTCFARDTDAFDA